MRVKVQAGAELDFATPDEVREILAEQLAHRKIPQLFRELSRLAVANGAAWGVADLGMPPGGWEWSVRRVAAMPSDAGSPAGVVLYVAVGGIPNANASGVNAVPPHQIRDCFNNGANGVVPFANTYGENELLVRDGQHLYVACDTAGFAATATVQERQIGGGPTEADHNARHRPRR